MFHLLNFFNALISVDTLSTAVCIDLANCEQKCCASHSACKEVYHIIIFMCTTFWFTFCKILLMVHNVLFEVRDNKMNRLAGKSHPNLYELVANLSRRQHKRLLRQQKYLHQQSQTKLKINFDLKNWVDETVVDEMKRW